MLVNIFINIYTINTVNSQDNDNRSLTTHSERLLWNTEKDLR
jgi:hypothetical protein